MKVLFLFGGMPYYLSSLLLKLQESRDTEVSVILPASRGSSIGKGVKLTEEEHPFKVIKLPEYKSVFGKAFFKGLFKTIKTMFQF